MWCVRRNSILNTTSKSSKRATTKFSLLCHEPNFTDTYFITLTMVKTSKLITFIRPEFFSNFKPSFLASPLEMKLWMTLVSTIILMVTFPTRCPFTCISPQHRFFFTLLACFLGAPRNHNMVGTKNRNIEQ